MSTDPSNAALDPSSASASAPQVDATAAQVPSDAELEERRAAALADWEEQVRFFRRSSTWTRWQLGIPLPVED